MDNLSVQIFLTHDAISFVAVYGGHFYKEWMLCLIPSQISQIISQQSIVHTVTYQTEKTVGDFKRFSFLSK